MSGAVVIAHNIHNMSINKHSKIGQNFPTEISCLFTVNGIQNKGMVADNVTHHIRDFVWNDSHSGCTQNL